MWSYDETLSTDRDKVRFLVQDNDDGDQLISDEEVDFALTQNSNLYRAGSNIAKRIALQLGRRPSVKLEQAGIDAKQQYDMYMEISKDLAAQATSRAGGVFVGGISKSDMETREADTDRVAPAFTSDLHEAPGNDPASRVC